MDRLHDTQNARCLICGYILYGLPEPVCPECGRAFDPSDESTFDTRPPSWRRKRMKRVAIALAIIALLFIFVPRGILKGQLTFVCNVCGDKTTVCRRELKAPSWMPFRYPSWHWTKKPKAPSSAPKPACDQHVFDVKVAFDLYNGGSSSASCRGEDGKEIMLATVRKGTLNWQVVTVKKKYDDVLRNLMSPTNCGISIWQGP